MLQLGLFFSRRRRGSWLGACLCWLLLGSAGLVQGQTLPPIMVRATPVGSVGLQVGQKQLLTATAVYPAFISNGFSGGTVNVTAVQPDGKILVGGTFTKYNDIDRKYLARLNADGTLDASFNAELDKPVYALVVQPSNILIGGDFTSCNGTPCGGLARLLPTGTLDPTFVTSGATANSSGNSVRAIAVQSTGHVVVGGYFTAYGSNPSSNYLVRLDNTGGFDPTFANNTHSLNFRVGNAVLALVVQSGDNILVGGQFGPGWRGIARLNSAGAPDLGFANNSNSGITSGEIAAIAELPTGDILVGGNFNSYSTSTLYSRLALLTSAGELATGFTPHFTPSTSVRVTSIVALSATKILVGGQFTEYDGTSYSNLVGITATGDLDKSFEVGLGFGTAASSPAAVNSLTLAPGGNVVVGGQFTTYKGITANNIARLKPTGKADNIDVPVPVNSVTYEWFRDGAPIASGDTILRSTAGAYWAIATATRPNLLPPSTSNTVTLTVAAPTLAPIAVHVSPTGPLTIPGPGQSHLLTAKAVYPALQVGTGFDYSPPSDRNVFSFKTQTNGKLVVGGRFTSYNGKPCQYVVRLDADGSLDPTFRYAASGGLSKAVTLVAIQPNGKILVGGDFTRYGTDSLNHLGRLNTDGTIDDTFKGGFSNSPTSIFFLPDGKMLMGGNFYEYRGTTGTPVGARGVVRLTADGDLDTGFALNTTSGIFVNAMALQPDGKVLVAGGQGYPDICACQRIFRLNPDGTNDPSFDPTGAGFDTTIDALALQPDGKVLVGGVFANHLIRLNADGSRDGSFTSPSFASNGGSASITVATLVLQSNGKILVGGNFMGGLYRLNTDGSPDPTFTLTSPGFDGKVSTLAIQPDGQILAGGVFASYGPTTGNRKGLARLNSDGSLNVSDTPVLGTATYAWSDGSTGPTLAVTTHNTYAATATFLGQTGLSNAVKVGTGIPAFAVGVTPTGPLSLCASGTGSTQILTAQVVSPPPGAKYFYEWWRVNNGGVASLGPASDTNTSYTVSATGQYFATATDDNGSKAASSTVSVGQASAPSLSNSVTGLPGTNVVLSGTDLAQVTGVLFGTLPAVFAVNSPAQNLPAALTVTVPVGATNGPISLVTACNSFPFPGSFSLPAPTLSSVAPQTGAPGSTVVLTGTGFIEGATTVTLNGVAMRVTVTSSTQLTAVVPPNATSGPLSVSTAGGTSSNAVTFTILASNRIVINQSTKLPAGRTYDNLLIVAPAVVTISDSTSTGNVGIIVNRLEVQDGATLNVTGNTIVAGGSTGSSFLLAAGATLNVGHPNGLGSGLGGGAAAPGAIQLTTLFLSPDANYGYIGTQPQVTGSNLPSQVRSLTSANTSRLTLTQAVSIAQVLTMSGAGHFYLDTKPLTLLSNATGTALVVNSPRAGRVLGTATVQRYINPAANTGTGFRYYGSPVKGATVAVLAAPAFDYDQSRYRLITKQDTLPLISYGFTTSALVPNTPLEVGHGYRAAVPAATTVKFTGTLTTGDTTITLTRTGNAAYNGWNLVSNPYPAPLNWSKLVAAADTAGIEAAIYVYESANTSVGSYRSYVNGVSNDGLLNRTADGDLLIAMGQAFFVRVRKGGIRGTSTSGTGTLTFRNAHRETSYAQQASFSRTTRTESFTLSASLERNGGSNGCKKCGQLNRVALYLDPNGVSSADQPFNPKLDADARNLFSFSQQTLSISAGATDSTLAIRAIAQPTTNQVMPLVLSATSPGEYTLQFTLGKLDQLNGTVPYLQDLKTNAPLIKLSDGSPDFLYSYPFTLSASEILSTRTIKRFQIIFLPVALATSAASAQLGSVAVFPNPAQHRIHVQVPAVPGATQVQATLFNALGQVVLRHNAALPPTGTALDLAAEKLAGGVYILRLQAGNSIVTRRVVLNN
jgi:uncharacterized delta-60 repeat protein